MGNGDIEVVKSAYEAFGRGDVPAVLATFADDIEWNEADGMPYGGVYHGGQEVVEQVFGPVGEDVEGFTVTPEEFIAADGSVAAVVRYTGKGNATGKELNLGVVHIWDVRDGKLTRFRQFADTAKFLEVVPLEAATSA